MKKARIENAKWLGFDDLWLRILLVPVLSFFFPMVVMKVYLTSPLGLFLEAFVISAIHIILYWQVDRKIVVALRKKYQLFQDNNKRLWQQTLWISLATLSLCLVSKWLQLCFSNQMKNLNIPFMDYLLASFFITVVIVSIYESRFAFMQWKNGLLKNEQLQKENSLAQLEALQNQVNPHFFFNSINTLISLIPEEPKTAVKFAENLSLVFRCVLEIKSKDFIPMQEELACVRAYQYLLKIRFGEQLIFIESGLDKMQDTYIVPLALQMLIENCVKHNIVSLSRPLTIRIIAAENQIVVSNNLQPKLQPEVSTKIGLDNINKRYEILANKQITVEQNEQVFSVKLPLINIEEVR